MNFRFTIGRKIGSGFGILIVLTGLIILMAINTMNSARKINDQIVTIYSPSLDALQELKILILNSKMLITNWANVQSTPDNPDKQNHIALEEQEYPFQRKRVSKLSENWNAQEQQIMTEMFSEINYLWELHDSIKSILHDFESYEDPNNKFLTNIMVEEGGDIDMQTEIVLGQLDLLIKLHRNNTNQQIEKMTESFGSLEFVVKYLGLALFISGILIAFFTVRSIVKPVQQLKKLLQLMGKGIIPKEKMKPRSDEIGEMSMALNDLVVGFKRTTEFAREVGGGNFESDYQPLSEHDSLGHALLKMRVDLHASEQELERKVKERTEEVVRQKEEIEKQKKEMEVLYTHVTDSIKYAKRIQEAILPPQEMVEKLLPNSFFLYRPKDIVSGDFYWVKEKEGKVAFAAVDCTGHGVPGAFMTIVGHNGLNRAIIDANEGAKPAEILDNLNKTISETLRQGDGGSGVKDGMDAAMCTIDYKTNEIQFAGAYNPLYLLRNGDIEQIKGDKFPIGDFVTKQKFTNHKLQLQEGDIIYIFSDGYADQFGGPKGKKFMYKKFRDLLLSIKDMNMKDQKKVLNDRIEEWKGELEQVDDILVIGLKIESK